MSHHQVLTLQRDMWSLTTVWVRQHCGSYVGGEHHLLLQRKECCEGKLKPDLSSSATECQTACGEEMGGSATA